MLELSYSIADQNVATTKSMGIYNLSLQLAQNLPSHPQVDGLTIFSNRTVTPALPASDKATVEEHNRAIDQSLGRIWWDQWGVYNAARAAGHPWLLLPKGFCSFITKPPVRVAAFVHDTMVSYYRERGLPFGSKLEEFYFTRCLLATLRHSDVLFTNTEFSRQEIMRFAEENGVPPPRVKVAGYGFESVNFGGSKKENRVLLFASKLPHKRTDLAIRFLDEWVKASRFDGVIDCIGILTPEMEKPAGSHWNWVGRVPPAQGREMIRRARAVVYISDYEGFGMPPVESVLEGTCPVFSDIPPLREVMSTAGFAFSNQSADSFGSAIDQALATAPDTIATWSKDLLARHNWPGVTGKIVEELLRTE